LHSKGLIPSKYFEKSTQRLNYATGTKLQINYELNNVYVCQDNVYFHIHFVLVKNMTDNVILGIPFIFMLYSFKAKLDKVSTVKMGVLVKFHFASRFEIDVSQLSPSLVHTRTLHCLDIHSDYKIVETNASKIGFRGILKQLVSLGSSEQIVQFHSGSWNSAQYNYSIIKKFFLLLKNIASKQIFAQWQLILSAFNFDIEYIKSFDILIPDFLIPDSGADQDILIPDFHGK
jgi:hypothetical protein